MKANIQTLQNFEVIRDGQPDDEYYRAMARRERLEGLKTAAGQMVGSMLRTTGRELSEAFTLIDLDMYDINHGTSLRSEYIQKRRAEKTAAYAAKLGLR